MQNDKISLLARSISWIQNFVLFPTLGAGNLFPWLLSSSNLLHCLFKSIMLAVDIPSVNHQYLNSVIEMDPGCARNSFALRILWFIDN